MIFPQIRSDMLCNIIPVRTYEYGQLQPKELFIWRTSNLKHFINGLNYQIHHLEPKHVVIYGISNRKYIDGKLLPCEVTWIKSWSEEHYTRRKEN
jgi:hypothetical protein